MRVRFRSSFMRDLKKVREPAILAAVKHAIEQIEQATSLSDIYSHSPRSSSAVFPESRTSIRTSVSCRAWRQRSFLIPPRSVTALCMPPPELSATVRRKRNTSRKFDLPEAFGPIR